MSVSLLGTFYEVFLGISEMNCTKLGSILPNRKCIEAQVRVLNKMPSHLTLLKSPLLPAAHFQVMKGTCTIEYSK